MKKLILTSFCLFSISCAEFQQVKHCYVTEAEAKVITQCLKDNKTWDLERCKEELGITCRMK